MTPPKNRLLAPARLLPQVERFVEKHVPQLCAAMQREEDRARAYDPATTTFSLPWHVLGKKPRVRDSRQFVNMVNVCLRMQLADKGYPLRDVTGLTGSMTFILEWERPRDPV